MDVKIEESMIPKIIGIVVAVVIASVVLIPIVDSATATTETYQNEGYVDMDKFADSYSLEWDASNPTIFTVNGEEVTYSNTFGTNVGIIIGKSFTVFLSANNSGITFYGNGTYVSTNATYPTFSLTYADGSVSATNTNASKVIQNVTEIYGMVEDGPYVMKKADAKAYLNSGSEEYSDSEIYMSMQSFSGVSNVFWHIDGTVEELNYPEIFNDTFTVTNKNISGTESTSSKDLFILNNVSFTITASNEVVCNVNVTSMVVPAEVTAEKSVHSDGITNTILSTIPIFVILGILMGIVGLMYFKR